MDPGHGNELFTNCKGLWYLKKMKSTTYTQIKTSQTQSEIV